MEFRATRKQNEAAMRALPGALENLRSRIYRPALDAAVASTAASAAAATAMPSQQRVSEFVTPEDLPAAIQPFEVVAKHTHLRHETRLQYSAAAVSGGADSTLDALEMFENHAAPLGELLAFDGYMRIESIRSALIGAKTTLRELATETIQNKIGLRVFAIRVMSDSPHLCYVSASVDDGVSERYFAVFQCSFIATAATATNDAVLAWYRETMKWLRKKHAESGVSFIDFPDVPCTYLDDPEEPMEAMAKDGDGGSASGAISVLQKGTKQLSVTVAATATSGSAERTAYVLPEPKRRRQQVMVCYWSLFYPDACVSLLNQNIVIQHIYYTTCQCIKIGK